MKTINKGFVTKKRVIAMITILVVIAIALYLFYNKTDKKKEA